MSDIPEVTATLEATTIEASTPTPEATASETPAPTTPEATGTTVPTATSTSEAVPELTPAQLFAALPAATKSAKRAPSPPLDLSSTSAFPSLGGGPAPAATAKPVRWGTGAGPKLSAVASTTAAAAAPLRTPAATHKPGQTTVLTLSGADKRTGLAKSQAELQREVARKYGVRIDAANNKENGSTSWVIAGEADAMAEVRAGGAMAALLVAMDELAAQAQALGMGYE